MRFATLFLAFAFLARVAHGAEEWQTYQNARFGFSVSHPKSLIASRDPTNGAGRELHTADREFSLSIQGHFLRQDEGDTFDKRWEDELAELGKLITYKRKGKGWYVVSGVTEKGVEFYHKFYAKRSNWVELDITYPHAKAAKYASWVTRLEKSVVPFREGDFDRLE